MPSQNSEAKRDGILKINGCKFYKYPEVNLQFNISKFPFRRYLHIATQTDLNYAKRMFTLVKNYEKTGVEKTKVAVVSPIIYYDGEIPTSVYDYVVRAPGTGGKYEKGYRFCLSAIANEEAIFVRPPSFGDYGIPRRVKEAMTIEDILNAAELLAQEHQTIENIIVPEENIAPNLTTNKLLKYATMATMLASGMATMTGAVVGAPFAPTPVHVPLAVILSLILLIGTVPVYRTFNRIEYQISKS